MELIFGIAFIIIVAIGNIKQATVKAPDSLPKNPPVIEVVKNEKQR